MRPRNSYALPCIHLNASNNEINFCFIAFTIQKYHDTYESFENVTTVYVVKFMFVIISKCDFDIRMIDRRR